MGPVTPVRPPAPVIIATPPPPQAPPGPAVAGPPKVEPTDALARDALAPVVPRVIPDQTAARPAPEARPAEAAAEEARRAYIRASLAAGMNPLPLPGR
jgi:hypothetical protein